LKEGVMKKKIINAFDYLSDVATEWIGSTGSIVFHTIFFIGIFVLYLFHVDFDAILLLLTTLVSLEAIYLSIFIQRSVNKQRESLEEVEESLEDVEEAIEEDDREDDKIDTHIRKQLEAILLELKTKKSNRNH
jgi:hypothetical protein